MNKKMKVLIFLAPLIVGCSLSTKEPLIQDVSGLHELSIDKVWLSHEHILVDFIGAEKIRTDGYDHEAIISFVVPYLEALKAHDVHYFVDATPNYLGRDVLLLEKIANKTGITILTNTGYYGAQNNKFIPEHIRKMDPASLADFWIGEFENGIEGTSIKPGFIKISIDKSDTLETVHRKLVKAAALTHLKTGLTIASHTGEAIGLWPQLSILKEAGVSPEAFIWVHAQGEKENSNLLKAAKKGCWISLDGMGWEMENHIEKILYAKKNGFLDRILISHDAGWYDPQKENQDFQPYTNIFEIVRDKLKSYGLTNDEFKLLISTNPSKAFSIRVRRGE